VLARLAQGVGSAFVAPATLAVVAADLQAVLLGVLFRSNGTLLPRSFRGRTAPPGASYHPVHGPRPRTPQLPG